MLVTYCKKDDYIGLQRNTCVPLAAFVTSYAREKLAAELDRLQKRVLYMDTGEITVAYYCSFENNLPIFQIPSSTFPDRTTTMSLQQGHIWETGQTNWSPSSNRETRKSSSRNLSLLGKPSNLLAVSFPLDFIIPCFQPEELRISCGEREGRGPGIALSACERIHPELPCSRGHQFPNHESQGRFSLLACSNQNFTPSLGLYQKYCIPKFRLTAKIL